MITAILMASGESKRFGNENKLLIEYNEKSIFEMVLDEFIKSLVDNIMVITSHNEIKEICNNKNIKCFINNDYKKGQGTSVKLGVSNADDISDYIFCPCDMPFINYKTIDKLIISFNKGNEITRPIHKDIKGSPVIFPNKYKENLLNISDNKGGLSFIKNEPIIYLSIDNEKELIDIDTKEEYKKWLCL